MNEMPIKCALCKKSFLRSKRQVNEAKKFGWNQFCSVSCMGSSRMTGIELKCANSECENKIYRPPKEIKKVAQSFCSRSCSAKTNNKLRIGSVSENHCRYAVCGIPISRSKHYCTGIHANKSRKVSNATYTDRVLAGIREFHSQYGRIPVKREVAALYKGARAAFGNWNNAVTAAGFEPNPVLFANRYIANDGHQCDSFTEKIIDDRLSVRGIPHQRRLPYPGSKLLSVDFVSGDKWIEFFGLAGEIKKYDKIIARKRDICQKAGINLVEIYPKDLFPAKRRDKFLTEILR